MALPQAGAADQRSGAGAAERLLLELGSLQTVDSKIAGHLQARLSVHGLADLQKLGHAVMTGVFEKTLME
eukprot:3549383-Amphidinium_carterae.1